MIALTCANHITEEGKNGVTSKTTHIVVGENMWKWQIVAVHRLYANSMQRVDIDSFCFPTTLIVNGMALYCSSSGPNILNMSCDPGPSTGSPEGAPLCPKRHLRISQNVDNRLLQVI